MTLARDLDCGRCRELLDDHVAGELAAPLDGEVDRHLRACGECSALRLALAELRTILAPDGAPLLPAGFVERVAAASWARRRERPGPARMPLSLQVAAAVASVMVGGGALFGGLASHDPHSAPARVVQRTVNASLAARERAARVVEELRLLRVVVATAFEGRVEGVNDRVEDYRRLMERMRDTKPSPTTRAPGDRRDGGASASAGSAGQSAAVFPNSARAALVEARGRQRRPS